MNSATSHSLARTSRPRRLSTSSAISSAAPTEAWYLFVSRDEVLLFYLVRYRRRRRRCRRRYSPRAAKAVCMYHGYASRSCSHLRRRNRNQTGAPTLELCQWLRLELDAGAALPCWPEPNIVRHDFDVFPALATGTGKQRLELVAVFEDALCLVQIRQ